MKKKKDEITIRSSAAEYLTYVASIGDQQDSIEMHYEDENIWLTQKMIATLYDVDVRTINEHIKKIYSDSEYVTYLRLEHVKQLLQNTDILVTEVAMLSGYQNVSYFIRSFKKTYGVSPLKYRKIGQVHGFGGIKNYTGEKYNYFCDMI